MIRVSQLVGELNRRAPSDYAEDWDNVGLLAGDPQQEVTGVVVSVNLGPEALEVAEKAKANVIVCHHPPIFKATLKLTKTSHPYLFEAVRRGVSVVALHTNFDLASETMNREIMKKISDAIGGGETKWKSFLANRGAANLPRSLRLGKFITFVPEPHLEVVRKAVFKAGGGCIGEYDECSFSALGEGTFKGSENTNPTIGKPGQLEVTPEHRLEIIFSWKHLAEIVEAARKAHPYEEMAYDVYELANPLREIGYGFVADVSHKITFTKLVEGVKKVFELDSVTVVSDQEREITRFAFSPGSGSGFVGAAAAKGVQTYFCGEVGYHQMLEARQKGVTLVVLGHSYSERFFVKAVSSWCDQYLKSEGLSGSKVHEVFEKIHWVA